MYVIYDKKAGSYSMMAEVSNVTDNSVLQGIFMH